MTRLYLVRHGETEWNKAGRIQGGIDTELSDYGLEQAHTLGRRLAREKIDVIYSSRLKRAMNTARILGEYNKCNIYEADNNHEIRLGPWEGMTIDEIRKKYDSHYRVYTEDPSNFFMPGAETLLQLADRTYKAILDIVDKHLGGNILLVSHGTAIKAAMMKLLGIDLCHYKKFKIDNASITIIDFYGNDPERPVVICLNDTCHLKEASEREENI